MLKLTEKPAATAPLWEIWYVLSCRLSLPSDQGHNQSGHLVYLCPLDVTKDLISQGLLHHTPVYGRCDIPIAIPFRVTVSYSDGSSSNMCAKNCSCSYSFVVVLFSFFGVRLNVKIFRIRPTMWNGMTTVFFISVDLKVDFQNPLNTHTHIHLLARQFTYSTHC